MAEREPGQQLTRTQRKEAKRQGLLRQREQSTNQTDQITSVLWTIVSNVVAVIGGVAALLSFLPLFAVSTEPPLNPKDAFSTMFVLEYDGMIPIADVRTACIANHVLAINGLTFDRDKFEAFSNFESAPLMGHGDALTVSCDFSKALKTGPIASADITISVEYRPILIPSRIAVYLKRWLLWWQKDFRFITVHNAQDELVWIREPTSAK